MENLPRISIPSVIHIETISIPLPTADVPSVLLTVIAAVVAPTPFIELTLISDMIKNLVYLLLV